MKLALDYEGDYLGVSYEKQRVVRVYKLYSEAHSIAYTSPDARANGSPDSGSYSTSHHGPHPASHTTSYTSSYSTSYSTSHQAPNDCSDRLQNKWQYEVLARVRHSVAVSLKCNKKMLCARGKSKGMQTLLWSRLSSRRGGSGRTICRYNGVSL
jgi:hypothetical protein